MTAHKSAAELLDEIQTETAQELLNSILYEVSPPGYTGLPGLDAQLLFNIVKSTSSISSLNRGDVIEVQGPAASGKTHLAYHLTMRCILPHEVFLTFAGDVLSHRSCRLDLGGWGKSAVVMDSDGRWSIARLRHLLLRRLEMLFPALPEKEKYSPTLETLHADALSRVHVFRPSSTLSLAATLLQLPEYHRTRMRDEEMALLVVDSISSFYWLDRYALELQQGTGKKYAPSALGLVLTALQDIRLKYGPVIILTNWGLSPVARDPANLNAGTAPGTGTALSQVPNPSPFYRQHLHPFPAPFEIPARVLANAHLYPPITYHITLPLPLLPSIPPEVANLENAKEAEINRRSVVQRGEIMGILRVIESGATASFVFRVLDDEIAGI